MCVLGCGGLGGYIIEMIARAGVGTIKVIDGDVFDQTNLNRQLLSNEHNMNTKKVLAARERVQTINSEIQITCVSGYINHRNAREWLEGYDVVIDGLDHIGDRKTVATVCDSLGIPFVYGAIAGWYGQVATIMPGDKTLDVLYQNQTNKGAEVALGNPSFTPALVASIQVSETIKYLLGKGDLLTKGFLHMDLLTNEIEIISIN